MAPMMEFPEAKKQKMNDNSMFDSTDELDKLVEFVKNNPRNAEGHYELGLAYYKQARLIECVNSMERALKLNASLEMEKASDIKLNATMAMQAITKGEVPRQFDFFLILIKFIFSRQSL